MSRLTNRQRKFVYFAAILALAAPIIILGAPSTGERDSGGVLAKLRELPVSEGGYDLGETTFGKLDPSSAAMNLVLLGLRGPAVSVLQVELIEKQKTKNWAQMRAITDSIITLQPHYLQVWRFNGWNLSYNVSAEWDGVADRWYWVKEGAKFQMRGVERNRIYSELPWEVGRIESQKVGRADEWQHFRVFFLKDPETEKFQGGPDPEFNRAPRDPLEVSPGTRFPVEPAFSDNYLCSKAWFLHANLAELNREQHIMMRMLFRHYPVRSQFDYAEALQRDGNFEEKTRFEWDRAYDEWTGDNRQTLEYAGYDFIAFGKEQFDTPEAGTLMLNPTPEDYGVLARKDEERFPNLTLVEVEQLKRDWVERYQRICNFIYWLRRARLERRDEMARVHREIHRGQEAFREGLVNYGPNGELPVSVEHLERGLTAFAALSDELAQSEDTREEVRDTTLIEEMLMGVVYWRYIVETINGRPIPDDFPLHELWNSEEGQAMIPELRTRFQREALR